jgi:predicted PurR-regulated permease PerM
MEAASAPASGPPARPSATSSRVVLRIVLIVVLVVLALWLIYQLRRPLTWVFIAGFLAIALSGPVNLLQRSMRRGFAIALVYVGLILVPVLVAAMLVPRSWSSSTC